MPLVDLVAQLESKVDELQALIDAGREAEGRIEGVRAAIASLRGTPARVAKRRRKARPQGSKRRPRKKGRKGQKRAAKKGTPPRRLRAPKDSAEPRVVRGRLPSKNVECKAFDTRDECRTFVTSLEKRGLRRCRINERLAPGLFDVYDRDGLTVQWRELEEEAS